VTRAKNIFTQLWQALENTWRKLYNEILKGFTNAWENIVEIWRAVWEVTITALTKAWESVTAVWQFIWETLVSVITKTWEAIVSVWKTLWEVTIQSLTTTWNTIASIWNTVWTTTISSITTSWDVITSVWKSLWTQTISPITSSLKKIADDLLSFRFPSFSWPDIPKPNWLIADGGFVMSSASKIGGKISDMYKRSDAGKAITSVGTSISRAAGRLGLASGGIVPPTGTMRNGILYAQSGAMAQGTDTVPAMLTPGEFVVNREAARYNLGLLSFMNKAKAPLSPVQSPTTISVIINAKTELSPEQIKREVIPTLERELRRKSLDGKFVLASQGLR
jgi:hypothetical protein